MADSRYTKNNASVGQVWSEAYADNLDNQIDALSKRFWYVDDQTWVTQNATYNGSGWDRIDIGKAAFALQIDVSNNYMRVLQAAAGSNPIAWGTMTSIDSSGNLTAPALNSSTSVIGGILAIVPSATVLNIIRSSSAYLSNTSYQEVCAQEIPVQYRSGQVRLYAEMSTAHAAAVLYARWKKNGAVVASQSFTGSTGLYPWTNDLAYSPGDVFSLETYLDPSGGSLLYLVSLVDVRGTETVPESGYVPWT